MYLNEELRCVLDDLKITDKKAYYVLVDTLFWKEVHRQERDTARCALRAKKEHNPI